MGEVVDDKGFPMFYEPETGRVHAEGWKRFSHRFVVSFEGWIQESCRRRRR